MLGVLEMDVKTCIEKYLEMAPDIFPEEGFVSGSKFVKLFKGLRGIARFDEKALETHVKNLVVEKFGELGQDTKLEREQKCSNCHVFVCVTNQNIGKAFRLRNYRSSWEEGTGCTIWQAARATSAAPLYFPPVKFGIPPSSYVDGGLRYNNPIRALIDEAKHVWPTYDSEEKYIISIGTGVPQHKPIGKTGKEIIQSLTSIATDTQETATDFADQMEHESRTQGSDSIYARLNVEQGLQDISLEEWKDFDNLTGATNYYLNNHKKEIERCVDALLNHGIFDMQPTSTTTFLSEIPLSSGGFFGRVQEMARMSEILRQAGNKQKVAVLWGLAGSGKTRLVLEYINRFGKEYGSILWINAASLESATESYSLCAQEVIAKYKPASLGTRPVPDMRLVHRWLTINSYKSWLLVIDSLDDLDSFDCRRLLPHCDHGTIIITSTQSNTADTLGFSGLEVDGLTESASCEMLLSRKSDGQISRRDLEIAKRICKTLGGIPLAIEQARASLSRGIAICEFLGFYDNHYQELMAQKPVKSAWSYEKNRSILSTFNMVLTKLNGDLDAANLLTFASCFDSLMVPVDLLSQTSKSDVRTSTLRPSDLSDHSEGYGLLNEKMTWLEYMSRDTSSLTLRSAILRLEDLSLLKVRRDLDGKLVSFFLHSPLCKWRLETTETAARADWVLLASYTLSKYLSRVTINTGVQLKYLPFVKCCDNMIRTYTTPQDLEAPNGRLCHHYGTLAESFAQILLGTQSLKQAETMLRSAIAYQTVLQGSSWPQDRLSLGLIRDLAETLWKGGKLEEAADACESLAKSSQIITGSNDDLGAGARVRMRDIWDRKIGDAESLQRATIANQGEKGRLGDSNGPFPDEHPEVSDLDDEGWSLLQQVEQGAELLGENFPETLDAMTALAHYYTRKEAYSNALSVWERLYRALIVTDGLMLHGRWTHVVEGELICRAELTSSSEISSKQLKDFLLFALFQGRLTLIEDLILLERKSTKADKLTDLQQAIWREDLGLVEHFLKTGADMNVRDIDGETPLMILVYRWNPSHQGSERKLNKMITILLEFGADINAINKDRSTALHLAVIRGSVSTTRDLLEVGARVNAKNSNGHTPLFYAIANCANPEVAKLLIEHGAEVNAKNSQGQTPLDYAVVKVANPEVAKLLIEYGAEVNAKNSQGQTPLFYAVAHGANLEFAKLLMEYGAEVNAMDDQGRTPLDIAIERASSRDPWQAWRSQQLQEIMKKHGAARAPNKIGKQVAR